MRWCSWSYGQLRGGGAKAFRAWLLPPKASASGLKGSRSHCSSIAQNILKHLAPGQWPRRQAPLEGEGQPGVRRRSQVGGWKQSRGEMTRNCQTVPRCTERIPCRCRHCSQHSASHTRFEGSHAGIPHCRRRGFAHKSERSPFDVGMSTEAPESRGAPCAHAETPLSTLMEIQKERGIATKRRGIPPRMIRRRKHRRRRIGRAHV